MKASSWPDEHIATLKAMWSKQRTAQQISDVLPYSRNAVLAMARRLNLEARRSNTATPEERFDRVVELIAEHEVTLAFAAKQTRLPAAEARKRWAPLVARYDFGLPMTFSDDTKRPERP